jgi:TPP-dependent pyruvate/acetoin dehydrogenase alpha subunit
LNEVFYRALFRIRRVEEEIARIYPTDKIKSPVHLSIGQEGVSVGVATALTPRDVAFGTYRSHALYLAKGGDLRAMIAELYGKASGCAKGKGGSMHLIDVGAGVMGASAVVATAIPLAVGYAYALKTKRSDAIVVSIFGDGAVDEGAFHESLNFAALKRLPILFVCENNQYAIHSRQRDRQLEANLCARAAVYGMPTERIDGNDVAGLHTYTRARVAELRAGAGPRFVECTTYRWKEHVGPGDDFHAGYRTRGEAAGHFEKDAVRAFRALLDSPQVDRIEREVEDEIAAAFRFAEESAFPDPCELTTDCPGVSP